MKPRISEDDFVAVGGILLALVGGLVFIYLIGKLIIWLFGSTS